MGLGKTIMALALIIETKKYDTVDKLGTLIIVPKSVLTQWTKEIKLHSKNYSLSYYVYYDIKERTGDVDLSEYDIILTTYAILASDFVQKFNI